MSEPKRNVLRLGLPKGSLQATTHKLFTLAGFKIRIAERSYYPDIDDPEIECILIRAQEMARYVEQGILDVGITGVDWTLENGADVTEVADLRAPWPNYGPVRWVVAVKEDSEIRNRLNAVGVRGRSVWNRAFVFHCPHALDPTRLVPADARREPDRHYYRSRKGAVRCARGLVFDPGAEA